MLFYNENDMGKREVKKQFFCWVINFFRFCIALILSFCVNFNSYSKLNNNFNSLFRGREQEHSNSLWLG